VSFLQLCLGWWQVGYSLTAQIAYNDLIANNPRALEVANDILSILKEFKSVNKFVEAAAWTDDIKPLGLEAWANWHFEGSPKTNEACSTVSASDHNLNWSINQCMRTLKTVPVKSHTKQAMFAKSIMLRNLIHLIGDLHQPLHVSSSFDRQHSNGGQNGELFKVMFKDGIEDLHTLWDSVFSIQSKDFPKAPISSEDALQLGALTRGIESEYSRNSLEEALSIRSVAKWVQTSHEIEANFVYRNIKEGAEPSAEYLAEGSALARRQIALAGYRLSDLIQEFTEALVGSEFNDYHLLPTGGSHKLFLY